jgi:hypothetical protein
MRKTVERTLVAAAMAAVLGYFAWAVTSNGGFEDWGDQDYYRQQVRGWRQGTLALAVQPAPELLALADPYDPRQNAPHRLGDASLFRGKYYLYFGAAPAFTLMLPVTMLTGWEMTTGAAVLVFCSVAFLAASGLWLAIRRRYFPESAVIVAPLGVLALGFGTHLLALAQRAMFWELPIAAGLAFTLLALVAVFRALHGPRPERAMAWAGLALALAVASRPTCLFAAPLLLAPLWKAWRDGDPARPWWRLAVAAAVPLAACGVAVMAHNYARFGNPLEFGQHYQLSGAYESKWVHFSARFIGPNAAVYFFQPVAWSWTFPFVSAPSVPATDLPGYFGTEEVCGIAVTFFFVWFVLGLPLAGRGRTAGEARAWQATLLAIGGAFGPVALLLHSYFSTTARYQADFAVTLGVLALCGLLAIERAARPAGLRVMVVVVAGGAVAATVTMGLLVGFDYHGRAWSRNDPAQWVRVEHGVRRALSAAGRWAGQFDGPRVLKVRFRAQPTGTTETFWRAADPRMDERIVIEHIGARLIRFGHARGTEAVRWGRPLKWERDHTHTVEVQVPSLYRPPHGAWHGLRRDVEFRERSGVAVWFSGGRALDAIVEPWPAPVVPGGAVGADFSGEVRAQWTRLFRADEVRESLQPPPAHSQHARLRLELILPDAVRPEGEPLLALGAHYASDILWVRPAPGGVRFVFTHHGAPPVESLVVLAAAGLRVVEIESPSFWREGKELGLSSTGDVIVRLDGQEIIRARQTTADFFPGTERIGRNPFGTDCGPEFRGWILNAEWR